MGVTIRSLLVRGFAWFLKVSKIILIDFKKYSTKDFQFYFVAISYFIYIVLFTKSINQTVDSEVHSMDGDR